MDGKGVLEFAKKNGAVMVDLKFMDLPGLWQHFTVPISQLEVENFEVGFGFDGSSIRGWQPIHASDMLVIPDPATVKMDPFTEKPTISLICNIVDPVTKERYSRDPRYVATKADAYLKSTGLADTAFFGPEAEFFILNDVRMDQNQHCGYYYLDSNEGFWNAGRDEKPNLGYKPRYKEGYFPAPPTDSQMDLRTEMVLTLESLGLEVEAQHHEVATAGQAEIDLKFLPLVEMGDSLMWFKYVLKNVAHKAGKTVTFMPKPIFGDNGSGMHVHISLWKAGKALFAGKQYGGLSEMALHFIAGVIRHAHAVCAFTNPTTNSYRRLVPGFEAPINLAYSSRNRSAAIRIPMYSASPKAKRADPLPGPVLQRLPCLLRAAHGRTRWHREKLGRRAAGQGHLRPEPGRTQGRAQHPGFFSKSRFRPWKKTMTSCSKAMCSPRTCWKCGLSTRWTTRSAKCASGPLPGNLRSILTANSLTL